MVAHAGMTTDSMTDENTRLGQSAAGTAIRAVARASWRRIRRTV